MRLSFPGAPIMRTPLRGLGELVFPWEACPSKLPPLHSPTLFADDLPMRHLGRAGLLICCLASGCSFSGNSAALEAQLRAYEDRVAELDQRLADAERELLVARRETTHLRTSAKEAGAIVLASEQTEVLFRAESLRINKLLTGGINLDDQPGDESLNVVIEPLDARNEPIKLPGELTIEIMDPAIEEGDKSIGRWNYSASEVRDAWHNGLFVTGFKFRIDWRTIPRHETLVIHARLATIDGRTFHATSTVQIELPQEPARLPEEPAAPADTPPTTAHEAVKPPEKPLTP